MSEEPSTLKIQIERTDQDQRLIFGWTYVSRLSDGTDVWDLKNAHIPPDVIELGIYNYLLDSRKMGFLHIQGDDGKKVQVGRLIESMCFTREKWEALGISREHWPFECAWWTGFYVENDMVWDRIKSGDFPDFSLSGIASVQYLDKD